MTVVLQRSSKLRLLATHHCPHTAVLLPEYGDMHTARCPAYQSLYVSKQRPHSGGLSGGSDAWKASPGAIMLAEVTMAQVRSPRAIYRRQASSHTRVLLAFQYALFLVEDLLSLRIMCCPWWHHVHRRNCLALRLINIPCIEASQHSLNWRHALFLAVQGHIVYAPAARPSVVEDQCAPDACCCLALEGVQSMH